MLGFPADIVESGATVQRVEHYITAASLVIPRRNPSSCRAADLFRSLLLAWGYFQLAYQPRHGWESTARRMQLSILGKPGAMARIGLLELFPV